MKRSPAMLLSACFTCIIGGTSCATGSDDSTGPSGPPEGTLVPNQTLNSSGTVRAYHIYLPQEPRNAPVVVLLHGFGDSNDGLLGLNGKASPYQVWIDIARRDNLILVAPNGLNTGTEKGWNDCRSDATGNSIQDDVAFIRRLIDTVVTEHGADPLRVYATGTSNGGHFSIRLGLEAPDKIAAIAAIAASNSGNSRCVASRVAVSALFMNGTADPLLPYRGGEMAGGRGLVLSAAETVSDWVDRNGTSVSPLTTTYPDNPATSDNSSVDKLSFLNGRHGTEVVLYRITGGGHNEPSIRIAKQNTAGDQNRDIEMAEEVWAFFRPKSRPRP